MKKKTIYVLLAIIVVILMWTFFVPKSAVTSDFSLDRVERNGLDITDELSEAALKELEQVLLTASCNRWKNPIGAFPLRDDTIELTGMDSKGRIHFYLVGSTDRYAVNEYNLRNGRQLLESVFTIISE